MSPATPTGTDLRAPVPEPPSPGSVPFRGFDERAAASNFFSVKRPFSEADDTDVFTSFRMAREREAPPTPQEQVAADKVREVSEAARDWLGLPREAEPAKTSPHPFDLRAPEKSGPGESSRSQPSAWASAASAARAERRPSPAPSPAPKGIGASIAATRHFEKGLAAFRQGRHAEALSEWTAAVELDPENKVYRSNLKRLKKLMG